MRVIEAKRNKESENIDKIKTEIRVKKSNKSLMLKLIFALCLINTVISGLLLLAVWRILIEWAQKIL